MKNAVILIILVISINLFATENQADFEFKLDLINFKLLPEIELTDASYHRHYDLDMVSSTRSTKDGVTIVTADYGRAVVELSIEKYQHLSDAYIVNAVITAKDDINLADLYIALEIQNTVHKFEGPEAICKRDKSLNSQLVPFKDRVVEYCTENSSFTIIGSKFPEVKGVEVIENNKIYIYSSEYHKNYWRKIWRWRDWEPMINNQTKKGSFIIALDHVNYPLFNNYPSGKKGAFTLSSDADGESYDKVKAIYYGSNYEDHPDYRKKGLWANNLLVTKSIFGYNKNIYGLAKQMIADGFTIAYHTYHPLADSMSDLRKNLLEETEDLNIRYWIDHSFGKNPEDLTDCGWIPDSSSYILDILEEADFKYAWLSDGFNYSLNAFDDYCQLPHINRAMTKNYDLYFLGRRMAKCWTWNPNEEESFRTVTDRDSLLSIIEDRGLLHLYTHMCMGELDYRLPFIETNGDTLTVRDDVEERFREIDELQRNHGLWVAPAEVIYDRMLAIDSVEIVSIAEDENSFQLEVRNNSTYDIIDFELIFDEQSITHDLLSGENQQYSFSKIEAVNPDPPLIDYRLYFSNSLNSIMFSLKDNIESRVNSIKIYNLKGQLVKNRTFGISSSTYSVGVNNLASGVYLVKIQGPDFTKIHKTVIIR